ncbi:MAG: helix-turn-helix transcriptional regulator, partial [Treponema sp.]|nr:helix-turn-helix transcriptional regulator [Treponema sp.]
LRGERPVNEIAAELNMTQSAISHQLRILKTSRLIKAERAGKLSIYSLADAHVASILSQGLDHVNE